MIFFNRRDRAKIRYWVECSAIRFADQWYNGKLPILYLVCDFRAGPDGAQKHFVFQTRPIPAGYEFLSLFPLIF